MATCKCEHINHDGPFAFENGFHPEFAECSDAFPANVMFLYGEEMCTYCLTVCYPESRHITQTEFAAAKAQWAAEFRNPTQLERDPITGTEYIIG